MPTIDSELARNSRLEDNSAVRAELTRVADHLLAQWRRQLNALDLQLGDILPRTLDLVEGDLLALTWRDPASHGSWNYVLKAYSCFQAVFAYRLANAILTTPGADRWEALILARSITEVARVRSGVELHPAATIGPRFVVDHGTGTVVGEDAVIGSDCYILQGAVLGALGIANNPAGRRHPRLGDRVQVGGFARILGPITVGDDALIGSHVLIRNDVPPGGRVTVLHHYQTTYGSQPVTVYGVEMLGRHRLRLHGSELDCPDLQVDLMTPAQQPLALGDFIIQQRGTQHITVEVAPGARHQTISHIRVRRADSEVLVSIPASVGERAAALRSS
jgi:serine acetyltransferase